MSQLKYRHKSPNSDESLNPMMPLSLGSCQGYNWEAIMRQEALASLSQPCDEKKSHAQQIVKLEMVVSMILIAVVLLVGSKPQNNLIETNTDAHHVSQYQKRF